MPPGRHHLADDLVAQADGFGGRRRACAAGPPDVQVRRADTTGYHFDEYLVVGRLRIIHVHYL
jgi:hypothetical protein